MKKLILSAAIILGSLSTISAQAQDQSVASTEQTATSETVASTESAKPAEEFTEIKAEELPTAVTASLTKAYPKAVVTKAFVNEKKHYRLDIKLGDKEGSLFANESGKWIPNK